MLNKGHTTEGFDMTAKTATTAEIATELGTDPRTLRKFLRATTPKDSQPGKGSRYSLPATAREIASMKKAFLTWGEAEVQKRQEKADAKVAAEVVTDDEIDALDSADPTDEELTDLEN